LNIFNHIYGEEKDFESLKVWYIKIDKITQKEDIIKNFDVILISPSHVHFLLELIDLLNVRKDKEEGEVKALILMENPSLKELYKSLFCKDSN
jgi:uncharacterized pyridoxamine 5'-phosphate oxidase family protein